jgi:hypothetical protein
MTIESPSGADFQSADRKKSLSGTPEVSSTDVLPKFEHEGSDKIENEGSDKLEVEGSKIKSVPKSVAKEEFEFECGISEFSETDTEEEEYDEDVPSSPSDTDEEEGRDDVRVTYAKNHTKNPDLSSGESPSL